MQRSVKCTIETYIKYSRSNDETTKAITLIVFSDLNSLDKKFKIQSIYTTVVYDTLSFHIVIVYLHGFTATFVKYYIYWNWLVFFANEQIS